tara:strand:- start:11532 stop:12341 length:810 start_codon:yes stop_codon:yes gene_type:complete
MVPATAISLTNRALIALGDAPITSFSDATAQATIASTFYESAYEEFLGSTGWRWAMRTTVPVRHRSDARGSYTTWDSPPGTSYIVGDLVTNMLLGTLRYFRCIQANTSQNPGGGNTYWQLVDVDPALILLYLDPWSVPGDPNFTYQYALPTDFLSLYKTEQPLGFELAVGEDTIPAVESLRVIWSTNALETLDYSAKVGESLMPPYAQEVFVYKLAHLLAIPVQASRARSEYFFELYMKALRRAQAVDARQRPNASIVKNGQLPREWYA